MSTVGQPGFQARAVGIVRAAHAGPSAVVTLVALGLAVAAGLPGLSATLVVVAVATGQLSIGWCNDWWDATHDLDARRVDKPVTSGMVSDGMVRLAAFTALGLCVVASLALGWTAAAVHLIAVASGWSYNLLLKPTIYSVVPYVVSFGLLPSVVTAAAGAGLAPWWAGVTGACFGAGAHFANVLPDLEVDAATGVRGLPQRLGSVGAGVSTVVLLGFGILTVALAPPASTSPGSTNPGSTNPGSTNPGTASVVGYGLAALLLLALVVTLATRRFDAAFRVAMATGSLVVLLLILQGGSLT